VRLRPLLAAAGSIAIFAVCSTIPGLPNVSSPTLLLAATQATTLPQLTEPVNDFARVIDPQSAGEMDRVIRALKAASGDVVVVATVQGVEPYADIRELAVKLFENGGRGIGEKGKDNGLLIVLAMKERRVWIEVGYGLEEWITDGFAGETSRDYMVPEFRNGRYGAGLLAGTVRIAGRIARGRNVQLNGVEVPVERREPRRISISWIILIFILIVIISRMSGGSGRRFRRGGWSGWSSGVGPFGGGWGGGFGGGGGGFGGGFGGGGGGFGGFGGGRSGGGGGGAGW
jgi:uncharacterized protein